MLSPVPPSTPFSVPNGGTGLATVPADRLVLGDGTNPLKSLVNGTATQTIGFTGAGNSPLATDFPGATNGIRVLATTKTLNLTNGTYQNIDDAGGNVSVTLPTPGTYLLFIAVRAAIKTSSGGGYLLARLWNQTAGSAVPNSEFLTDAPEVAVAMNGTRCLPVLLQVTGSTTVRLQGSRNLATSYTTTVFADLFTALLYAKVSP